MDKKTFTEKFNEHASTCYGIDQGNKKYIYGRVAIGGSSGGNCWGGTSTPYRTGREASEAEVPTLVEQKSKDGIIECPCLMTSLDNEDPLIF